MKKININIKFVLLFAFIMIIAACSDEFLEITPKGKLIASKTSQYEHLVSNGQPAGFDATQILLGDDIVALQSLLSTEDFHEQGLFKWSAEPYLGEDNPGLFLKPLNHIYHFNKIINEVMDSEGGTEEEKIAIRDEARAQRAWYFFYLSNFFGQPYNAATADTELGIPLILEADVNQTEFVRVTVKETYDFIVNELTECIPNLKPFVHRFRMSKPAAQILLGQVYVFMHQYDLALAQFNAAEPGLVGTAEQPLVMHDYNTAFLPGGTAYPVGSFGPNFQNSTFKKEAILCKITLSYYSLITSTFPINKELYDSFHENDMRKILYTDKPYRSSTPYPGGLLRKKGLYTPIIGIQFSEYHLYRAECMARTGDLTGAVSELEYFLGKRMPVADAVVEASIAGDQNALIRFIIEERKREFALQGHRWFDLRRLSADPLFASETYTKSIYDDNGDVVETFTLIPERLTLRYPPAIMAKNPNLINND